jgi:hypothetical protein
MVAVIVHGDGYGDHPMAMVDGEYVGWRNYRLLAITIAIHIFTIHISIYI